MPLLTRTFVKLAIVWLLVGLVAWTASAAVGSRYLELAAFHVLTVGWLTQMVFGVAIWLLPKRRGDQPRGSERLGWTVLGLLNVGVVLRTATEPFIADWRPAGAVVLAAGVLQALAAIGFALLMRGRIRGR